MTLDGQTSFDIDTLSVGYAGGAFSPRDVMEEVLRRIDAAGDDRVWIDRASRDTLMERVQVLKEARALGADLPLFGVPFAVKDNIDVAGWPTTAGCSAYAYGATASAPVVDHLLTAGAVLIGKTNLDQFATGLVGVRSPYGVSRNPFDERYIPGGSSSGSSVAVSSGLVSFALGTDTAGSGRVPAAFNNIVGLKPTRGRLSTRGVVPACRSLDCVSIFALTGADALRVFRVAGVFDPRDAYARADVDSLRPGLPVDPAALRIGVPAEKDLSFFGNTAGEALFEAAVSRASALGATLIGVDFAPFLEAARLLYEGPWVAERFVAIRDFIEAQPDALYPVTRQIIGGGGTPSAADAFAAAYRLEDLKRRTAPVWDEVDVLLTPTAGTIYTVAEVEADPVQLNSNLGYYTNYMNLLDLAAIAVPAGFQPDGLPFGVTLVAPPFQDEPLCRLGDALHRATDVPLGAGANTLADWPADLENVDNGTVRLCVVGAHMSGLPLNHQLTERGGRFLRRTRTAPLYRLYALDGFDPPRPGLARVEDGRAIEVEVWEVPSGRFGSFVDQVPSPLGIGTLTLEDGSAVNGFICEGYALAGAPDISELGGWRAYLERSA